MRVKVGYRSAGREAYKRFCSANPEIKIEYKDWSKVIYTFNEYFRDYMLETGAKVKMPYGFGPFAVNKKKLKLYKNFLGPDGKPYINLPIDWAKTKKAGKRVYHTNSHSDGYKYGWYWFSDEARFYLSEIWNFRPARLTSRIINTYVTKPDGKYGELYKVWKRK